MNPLGFVSVVASALGLGLWLGLLIGLMLGWSLTGRSAPLYLLPASLLVLGWALDDGQGRR